MSSSGFTKKSKNIIVESVQPLTDAQLSQLLTNLKLKKDTVEINNRHNPALLAGIRVIVEGKIIDLSFQNLLNNLSG